MAEGRSESVAAAAAVVQELAERVRTNIEQVIVGKRDMIDLVLVALFCDGHLLLEDVPGIGKTVLAKSVARTLGCSFRRIQCTPDLLPTDITGLSFFNQREQTFEFRPGPVFAQVVLVDEINRATPRTQAALLECMEERQVTVEGESRPLPRPFLVLATQNPIELEGTFPLPEAQLDRFLLRLGLGYPTADEELAILRRFRGAQPLTDLAPVISSEELITVQQRCQGVYMSEAVEQYIVALLRASREHPAVALGGSPRATLALSRAAQALAAIQGRGFVIPDDIKRLLPAVLTHRLIMHPQARLRGQGAVGSVAEILASVAVPVEEIAALDGRPGRASQPGGERSV